MRKTVADRNAGKWAQSLVLLAVLAASLALPERGLAAGLAAANYQLNWDESVNRTDTETTATWTFNHSLDIKYKGLLSPIIENEITMKISEQIKSEGTPRDTIQVNPVITLAYKGSKWSAGAKRTIDDSNEPNKKARISDSYFIELFLKPPRTTLPDLKGKYTLDKDLQSGTSDMLKHALAFSSVYKPQRWLELRGDYAKNWTQDRLKPDSDTQDDKYSIAAGIRHIVSPKLRVASEFKFENSTGATLLSAGGTTNEKHEQSYDWKNTVAFIPFRATTLDGSYDWSEKQNLVTGQHDYTQNIRVAVAQMITEYLDIGADFTRSITEPRHTSDDNRKTDDTWTFDVKPKLAPLFTVTLKWQQKHTAEEHFADPTKNTTSGGISRSASWTAQLMPFWKASASYDKTDTISRDVTTSIDTKYGLRSTFDFKPINVALEPSYDIAFKDDRTVTPSLQTETRDFKVKLAWKVLSTRNFDAKMDHNYGRKEDSAAQNVQRTDSSNLSMVWADPFPHWTVGINATRSANDTSGDDLPPDITVALDFKADYRYERFSMGTGYKYDHKNPGDNSEVFDFKWGWNAPAWDISMSYSFNKTFSATLKEGYTLGIAFKYNL